MEGELNNTKDSVETKLVIENKEELLNLWDKNIKEILHKGNIFRGAGNHVPVFSKSVTQKEMILKCLIFKLSIKEDKHWVITYGQKNEDLMSLKYEEESRGCEDLLIEADRLIEEYKKSQNV